VTALWALILAGGDGKRLQSLTQRIADDSRPKQFCPILDGETLLDRTRRRVDLLVQPDRQVIAVTQAHERYYRGLREQLAPRCLVDQPTNCDTGPGIVYPLLRVMELAGDVPLAIVPSDHYVSNDRVFMDHVQHAADVVRGRRDLIALLGIEGTHPETEYGWIQPTETPLGVDVPTVFPIWRFWEKPSLLLAQQLLARGCLWNTFVMVGWTSTFWELVRATAPALADPFDVVRRHLGTAGEARAIEHVYAQLRPMSFSGAVLPRACRRLCVVRVTGVDWSDWGSERRVVDSLRRNRQQPSWLAGLSRATVDESA
jgi:mannose-1-phosphate guanylyltransferase